MTSPEEQSQTLGVDEDELSPQQDVEMEMDRRSPSHSRGSSVDISPRDRPQPRSHHEVQQLIERHKQCAIASLVNWCGLLLWVGLFHRGVPVPIVMQYALLPDRTPVLEIVTGGFPSNELSLYYVALQVVESTLTAGCDARFTRYQELGINPIRELFTALSYCLIHVQFAMVVGVADPMMLFLVAVLTFMVFAWIWTAEQHHDLDSKLAYRLTAGATWLVLWVALSVYWFSAVVHQLQVVLLVLGILLILLEMAYAFNLCLERNRELGFMVITFVTRCVVAWTVDIGLAVYTQ
jgi:hypothetical protein